MLRAGLRDMGISAGIGAATGARLGYLAGLNGDAPARRDEHGIAPAGEMRYSPCSKEAPLNVALLAVTLVVAGPLPESPVDTTMTAGLTGEWRVVTYRSNGEAEASCTGVSATSTRLRFRSTEDPPMELEYTLGGDGIRGPIDVWSRRSPGTLWPGTYERQGGRLKICLGAWRGSQRPADLSAGLAAMGPPARASVRSNRDRLA